MTSTRDEMDIVKMLLANLKCWVTKRANQGLQRK